jgi:hypothetical protein
MPKFRYQSQPVEARKWEGRLDQVREFLEWMQGANVSVFLGRTAEDPLGQNGSQRPLCLRIDGGMTGQTAHPGQIILQAQPNGGIFNVMDEERFLASYAEATEA